MVRLGRVRGRNARVMSGWGSPELRSKQPRERASLTVAQQSGNLDHREGRIGEVAQRQLAPHVIEQLREVMAFAFEAALQRAHVHAQPLGDLNDRAAAYRQ